LLGLLLRPAQGELRLDGERISGLGDRERARLRARRFGFVFQDAALDASRTVLDNITEGAVYRLEDRRLLRQRAADLLDQLGVDVPLQRRPGEISGGQAQRIALCRALIHAPTVLLADEPTGNLDAASAGVVLDALAHAADAGAVVVIATHDERVVARCEQVERL
jgi:ABC-type lipoprotein export system ATPase subunit